MASVNFHLRDNKSDKSTPIVLYLSHNGQRIKIATGERIHPRNCNGQKQRAKKSATQAMSLNLFLKRLAERVVEIVRELKVSDGALSPTIIRSKVNQFLEKGDETKLDFHQFVQSYIEQVANEKSKAVIQRYGIHYKHLLEFEKASKLRIEFEGIDLRFYERLKHYIIAKKQLSENTFGSIIKTLKIFLGEATTKGYNQNLTFKHKKFKKIDKPAEAIYLTISEIESLYYLDLSDNEKLEKNRDAFIIGCYTGLRFSDFIRLEDHHFVDDQFVKIITQKTKQQVIIPMHPFIKAIREKYTENVAPSKRGKSNTTINKHLKELGRLANINTPIIQRNTIKGESIKRKYELITTHTARRSFATNAFLAGIPPLSIMKITGHKTERAFMRYIRISQQDNANKLATHPFFSLTSKTA